MTSTVYLEASTSTKTSTIAVGGEFNLANSA